LVSGSITTTGSEQTLAFGREAGERARPRDVWFLTGPLGAGKTVFVKGLAQGLGFEGAVTSPTFALHHIYQEGRLPLFHFDWAEQGGVTAVEWADRFPGLTPLNCMRLSIEILSPGERRLHLESLDPALDERVEELLRCLPR
jgi:tRNA threonylcarbamoyladenosine biosynthesis protein TsaE